MNRTKEETTPVPGWGNSCGSSGPVCPVAERHHLQVPDTMYEQAAHEEQGGILRRSRPPQRIALSREIPRKNAPKT